MAAAKKEKKDKKGKGKKTAASAKKDQKISAALAAIADEVNKQCGYEDDDIISTDPDETTNEELIKELKEEFADTSPGSTRHYDFPDEIKKHIKKELGIDLTKKATPPKKEKPTAKKSTAKKKTTSSADGGDGIPNSVNVRVGCFLEAMNEKEDRTLKQIMERTLKIYEEQTGKSMMMTTNNNYIGKHMLALLQHQKKINFDADNKTYCLK